jgi:mono/diheme cytochrome c family protein
MRSVLLWALAWGCSAPEVVERDLARSPNTSDPVEPTIVHTSPVDPPRAGTVVSPDGDTVFVADDDGTDLLVFRTGVGLVDVVDLGGRPARVVVRRHRAWVSLRDTGEVVRLDADAGWSVVARAWVGAEPVGLSLGDTVAVALSQEDAVVFLDPDDLALRGRAPVRGQPTWLTHAEDDLGRQGVVVFGSQSDAVAWLTDGTVYTAAVPTKHRYEAPEDGCVQRALRHRFTGDPAVRVSGAVVAPGLYIDTQLMDALGESWWCSPFSPAPNLYYAPPMPPAEPETVGRWNPVMHTVTFEDGRPVLERPLHLGAQAYDLARSVVSGLLTSDDGAVVATMPTTDVAVVLADPDPWASDDGPFAGWTDEWVVPLGQLPSVGLVGSTLLSWSPQQRVLRRTELDGRWLVDDVGTASPLPASVLRGRRLFHTSVDRRMVSTNSGGACANCHAEGRTDGLTWQLEQGDRQTPSLAGDVSETAPVTWASEVETVAEEALLTSSGRMGGAGLSVRDLDDLAAYVDWTPSVVRPEATWEAALGREAFFRPEVGCATCHVGERGTDNRSHQVFGAEVATNTPALTGVGATAPYGHDGTYPTLRTLVERARDGSMGDTSTLDDAELDALVAFLKSW